MSNPVAVDLTSPQRTHAPPPADAVDLSHPGALSAVGAIQISGGAIVGPVEVRDGDGNLLGTIEHNETA